MNFLLKNSEFLHVFFLFNGKGFDPNRMKYSDSMTKYTEIIRLKLKSNKINIFKDKDIYCKYFF